MNIKDLSKKSLDFTIKRVAEIIGILFICASVLLFLSLIFDPTPKLKDIFLFAHLLYHKIYIITLFANYPVF